MFTLTTNSNEFVKEGEKTIYASMSIAAVIVTYNRKEVLKKNIDALISQSITINRIIIVDNHSQDGTQEEIFQCYYSERKRFDYNYLPKNIGGAGGFEYGTRRAYELGFDLIWLMDDDGHPMNSLTLEKLIEKIESKSLRCKPFLLNSIVLCQPSMLTFDIGYGRDLAENERKAINGLLSEEKNARVAPFNGTLLSRELVASIGFPNGQLFIYGDESDYAARAVESGAFVATVVDSLYYHPKNNSTVCKLGREFVVIQNVKWRYYYSCRNAIYYRLSRKKYMSSIKFVIDRTLQILLFDDQKIRSLGYAWHGFFDGVRGRLGATVGPSADN